MSLMKWVTSPFLIRLIEEVKELYSQATTQAVPIERKEVISQFCKNSDILTELSQFSDITEFGRGL